MTCIYEKISNNCPDLTVADFLNKIILVMPFYSIESWLYHSYDKIEIKPDDYDKIDSFYKKHDAKLDHLIKIKNISGISSKYNLQLSEKFSTKKILPLEMSFAYFWSNLSQNSSLIKSLKSLHR